MSVPVPVPARPRPVAPVAPVTPGSVVAQRVLFAVVPLLSFGLLASVSTLWGAVVRRRVRDWTVFAVSLVTSVGSYALLGWEESSDNWQTYAGGALVLLHMFGTPVYAVVADTVHRARQAAARAPESGLPTAPPAASYGYGYPYGGVHGQGYGQGYGPGYGYGYPQPLPPTQAGGL